MTTEERIRIRRLSNALLDLAQDQTLTKEERRAGHDGLGKMYGFMSALLGWEDDRTIWLGRVAFRHMKMRHARCFKERVMATAR